MKSLLKNLYNGFLAGTARRLHFIRAGSIYHLACYHLRDKQVEGIVDAGAYDGQHSLYLTKLFPAAKIYAFEPTPDSFTRLCDTTRHSARIIPLNLALAEKEGKAWIHLNSFAPTNSLLPSATSKAAEVYFSGRGMTLSRTAVQTISLDQFSEQQAGFKCSLLKMDLQGYELQALRGARNVLRRQSLAVISEVRFKPLYDGDADFMAIDAYLAECGFSLACLQEVTTHPEDGTIFEANALWLKR